MRDEYPEDLIKSGERGRYTTGQELLGMLLSWVIAAVIGLVTAVIVLFVLSLVLMMLR